MQKSTWIMMATVACLVPPFVSAQEEAARPVVVGPNKQLFIDDYVIDSMEGVEKTLHQAQRDGRNPILKPEHPWEGRALETPIVFWDDELRIYRMYYWALHPDGIFTCYATSKDGLRWHKPILGLHQGPGGSRQNNIVLRGEGPSARTRYVVRNPYSDDPARKFLAMYLDNTPGLTEYIAFSPDGLNWTTQIKIGDLRKVTGAKPTPNPRFFLVEQRWAQAPEGRYRGIWRTESQDLETWSGGTMVIKREADDDPNLEFYHAAAYFLGEHTYHGLHLGYYYPFHTEPAGKKLDNGTRMAGIVDSSLMVSRDTVHWHLADRNTPLLPTGGNGSWDAGMVFVSPEVIVGKQMRFYYGAWRKEHSAGSENDGAIGLATLPLDRFVSLSPKQHQGWVTTKPFRVDGGQLRVNVDAGGGELRVAVLSIDGQPMAGFEAISCRPIRADKLDAPVSWRGHSLKQLQGKTIRLKFQLDRARLYAFQVK